MDFDEVYHRYSKDVFKFCLSLCRNHAVAEDITSEAFLKAIKSSNSFRGQCSIKVWLCQIAKNTYYDYLRKHSRITGLTNDMQSDSDFVYEFLDKDEAFRIHKCLHKLDDPYKEVFMLRLFAELPFLDIGKIFSKSESWARVTFHRAKIKLRESTQNDKM
ncbi:MAG: sigma-70 family RNA polymerase sigma factor [Defluviitaleaceae bacterium]|nr:sigma-70 family RNA polymerase sigma factor [Defluviitaleaceae bacterium]